MPETPRLPLVLQAEQQAFVERVQTGPTPVHILEGTPGTGKTVTMMAAVASLANSLATPRLMVVAPETVLVEQIAARLNGMTDVSVTCLTKAAYRELVAAGESIGAGPTILVLAKQLACHSDVGESLAGVEWDLIAFEDDLGGEGHRSISLERTDHLAVCFCEGRPIRTRKLVIVRDRLQNLHGRLRHDLEAGMEEYSSLTRLSDPFVALQESVVLATIPYTRSYSEINLLRQVAQVANSVPDPSFREGLLWAAMSSFAALSQEVLRERNRLVHGIAPLVDRATLSIPLEGQRTIPEHPLSQPELVRVLMDLAEAIDHLDHDSKLESLVSSIINGAPQLPVAIFAHHTATHRYLRSELRDLDIPLHVVTPRAGDSQDDLSAIQAFDDEGGILLASPEQLQGIEIPASWGIVFDLPGSEAGMWVLRTRIQGRDGTKKRLAALSDLTLAFPVEQQTQERYGFPPPAGQYV